MAGTFKDVKELIDSGKDIEATKVINESSLLLKKHDAEIDIVVISHGMDQFQLTKLERPYQSKKNQYWN